MENKISNKIIASLMLTALIFSNSLLTVSAMENVGIVQYGSTNKPALRDEGEYSLKLKGDVSFIKKNPLISISLRDSDVKQVLRMFADKAGMNIVFHSSVFGSVTLDLVDVPLNDAFNMVMEINDLNYVVDNKTIIVAKAGTSGFNFAKQDMTLIPVKYISAAALADFLNKNIYGMHKPGFSDTDIVTTNPVTNELIIFGTKGDVDIAKKVVEKFDKKPQTTTFKVNHTTPAEMADMICNMLLPAASGSGSSSASSSGAASTPAPDSSVPVKGDDTTTGGAAGIVTGGAADASGGAAGGGGSSGISLNAGTVACTIDGQLSGSVSSFGLQNLSVAYYSQLGTINIIGGSEKQIEMIKDFIAETDKKQPQAYLEVAIIELNEDGSKTLQNNWTFLSNAFSATFDGETTRTDPLHPIFLKGNGYEVWDTSGDEPELVNTLTPFKGPVNISYAINYLVRNSKGRVVSNPKILITNGEEATIDITQDYIESTETEQTAYTGGTLATRTYNIGSDAGIKVGITPFISPDGYVTLNIKPEYATILSQVTAQDTGGQYIAATLLSRRNLDLKNVRIKDGETLVIGGLISEEEQKTIGKVPVLGDIPLIGTLFRSTSSEKKKNEMVIMITPKIITDTEDGTGNIETL
uniref:secretin N-terminal domain-containing protein n=1 Tax=Candidatus Stercorousia sp. TaxID=3048886 RepID=UPI0040283842